jgi:hypothetical protein
MRRVALFFTSMAVMVCVAAVVAFAVTITGCATCGGNKGTTINGTASADNIAGGAGGDTINGRGGNDQLYGDGGNDIVNGAGGNDRLDGGNGNNTLNAGAGNDFAMGNSGSDHVFLGDGGDIANVADLIPGNDLVDCGGQDGEPDFVIIDQNGDDDVLQNCVPPPEPNFDRIQSLDF